ncbi:Homeobox-leucine zipper protein [Nymphaea thermarum]|nr:Homeobox-leucine zipper protein [Nymphaea thermarum]
MAMDSMLSRPFYGAHDDMVDDEFLDEHMPEKKRRLTPEQVHLLERSFETENKLEPERKSQLAKNLGLQPRQVAVWFQNRRARWKTKQLERDFDLLKSAYDSLSADYQGLVKETERLKSEVAALQDKLVSKEMGSPKNGSPSPETCTEKLHCNFDQEGLSSGGSVIVDEDGPQLIDSGNSDIPSYVYVEAAQSGEEDEKMGSSDEQLCDGSGSGYSAGVYGVAGHAEDEQFGWFMWCQ